MSKRPSPKKAAKKPAPKKRNKGNTKSTKADRTKAYVKGLDRAAANKHKNARLQAEMKATAKLRDKRAKRAKAKPDAGVTAMKVIAETLGPPITEEFLPARTSYTSGEIATAHGLVVPPLALLVSKDEVLATYGARAASQPGGIELAAKVAEDIIADKLVFPCTMAIERVRDNYVAKEGIRDNAAAAGMVETWDEGLDAALESYLSGDATRLAGVGFIGEHCIDSRLHEPGEATVIGSKLARALASGLRVQYQKADHSPSAAKFLAAIGIVAADLEIVPATNEDDDMKSMIVTDLQQAVHKALSSGAFDVLDIREVLEGMNDSDDVLATSAARRFEAVDDPDLHMSVVNAVRSFAKDREEGDWVQALIDQALDYNPEDPLAIPAFLRADHRPPRVDPPPAPPPPAAPPPVVASAPPATRGRKPKAEAPPPLPPPATFVPPLPPPPPASAAPPVPAAPPTATTPPEGNPPGVLAAVVALADHGGMNDRALGEALGMSRSSVNNLRNGKGPALNAPQRATVAQLLDAKMVALQEAALALGS